MKIYNKLVRDKIPEIVAGDNGKTCVTRIMEDDEHLKALNAKMQEELKEYLESGDVEELALDEKFDLIVSNATLQWAEDLKSVVSKLNNMLKDRGILAFSIFGNRNLEQMSKILQRGLKYYSVDQLRELFSDYKILLVRDEIIKLNFESPIDVLKHIKFTGTNALTEYRWSKSGLKNLDGSDRVYHFDNQGAQQIVNYMA